MKDSLFCASISRWVMMFVALLAISKLPEPWRSATVNGLFLWLKSNASSGLHSTFLATAMIISSFTEKEGEAEGVSKALLTA